MKKEDSFSWSNYWYYLLFPSICSFGVLTNLINIVVFSNSKMRDPSFIYLLAISIGDLFYLVLEIYGYNELCTECPLYKTYFTQLFSIYIDDFLTSSLAIFCIMVDIALSIQRYMTLLNKRCFQSINHRLIITILGIIALLYYLPVAFFKDIVKLDSLNGTLTEEFIAVKNELGMSTYGRVTPILLATIRMFLGIFVLTGINILNLVEFRKRCSIKISEIRMTESSSKRINQ